MCIRSTIHHQKEKRSHISGLLIVGLSFVHGACPLSQTLSYFFRVKGIPFSFQSFPFDFTWNSHHSNSDLSMSFSIHTHVKVFFFPLQKWQQNNKTNILSTICHLYFYISHLSTNPLSISASSISNYFSFHFILPSRLNHLWTHH